MRPKLPARPSQLPRRATRLSAAGPSDSSRPRGLLALMCVASLAIGTENVSLSTVWQASPTTGTSVTSGSWSTSASRGPCSASLVGLALGLSGTLIQAVGRNPLADTEILGINSGAALFVVCAIALLGLAGIWTYIWFAFAGALFAMMLVYLVGMSGRATVTPVRVLLAGVAIAAVMDGVGYAVRLRYPRAFDNMRFWDSGALDGRPLEVAAAISPFIAVGAVLCLIVSRSLNITALGEDLAKSMGGNVVRTQVLEPDRRHAAGRRGHRGRGPDRVRRPDGPHAVRRFTGPDWRWILAYAVVVAPALLLAADIVGRVVIRPAELPAGIVTAFVGAPVLIWLIRKRGADRT